MFDYTKALPLALLFSLPAFAMEGDANQALAATRKVAKPAPELMNTVFAVSEYEKNDASCAQLLAQHDELSKKITEVTRKKDSARADLTAKIEEKDTTLAGILKSIEEQTEAKKKHDAEKSQKEEGFKTYNEQYTTTMQTIAAKIGELRLSQETTTSERKKLQDILDGVKPETKAWYQRIGNLIGGGSK